MLYFHPAVCTNVSFFTVLQVGGSLWRRIDANNHLLTVVTESHKLRRELVVKPLKNHAVVEGTDFISLDTTGSPAQSKAEQSDLCTTRLLKR